MKLKQKYVHCFDLEKSETLNEAGYDFLYEKDGIYYHLNNEDITVKFSDDDILKDCKLSTWIAL